MGKAIRSGSGVCPFVLDVEEGEGGGRGVEGREGGTRRGGREGGGEGVGPSFSRLLLCPPEWELALPSRGSGWSTGRDASPHATQKRPCVTLPPLGDMVPQVAISVSVPCNRHQLRHWHVHQLVHQLRLLEQRALWDLVQHDLGHLDHLLDVRQRVVGDLEHFRQLVLRHEGVENRDGRDRIDDLLHGAPLHPLLRPDVRETVKPRTAEPRHAVVVEEEVLRAGERGEEQRGFFRPWPCASPRTHTTPQPWPSSGAVRCGA